MFGRGPWRRPRALACRGPVQTLAYATQDHLFGRWTTIENRDRVRRRLPRPYRARRWGTFACHGQPSGRGEGQSSSSCDAMVVIRCAQNSSNSMRFSQVAGDHRAAASRAYWQPARRANNGWTRLGGTAAAWQSRPARRAPRTAGSTKRFAGLPRGRYRWGPSREVPHDKRKKKRRVSRCRARSWA